MKLLFACVSLCLITPSAQACDTALALTIDVSNSIDVAEFRLQTEGLADALLASEVAEALVQGHSALAIIQWSGEGRQQVSVPWAQMRSILDVQIFAQKARSMERAFVLSDTAPGDAIRFALDYLEQAPECARQVIDISGDGTPNSGSDTRSAARQAELAGVTINAIAIESIGLAISNFYQRTAITRDGFVVTARRHLDYPRAIRAKILREVSRIYGQGTPRIQAWPPTLNQPS